MQKYIRGLFFLLLITFITNIIPVQAAPVDEKAATGRPRASRGGHCLPR